MFSKVLKAVAHRRNHFLRDQDAVIRQIAMEHGLVNSTVTTKTKSDKENDKDQKDDDGDGDDDNEEEPDGKETPSLSANFSFIVTRATVLLKDGSSTKTLAASKSVRTVQ
jgi:hypothetical protein